MSEIFISYKREEQPLARRLADALEGEGWTVWWDPKLRAGEHFDDVIEKALNEAKCVIVMWSERSVQSRYVRDEATYALERDKLVPVAIEKVTLPFRFKGVHTPSLLGWDGSKDFSEFCKLVEDISTILGPPAIESRKEQAADVQRSTSQPDPQELDSRLTAPSPKTNADLVRLEHADSLQLSETLKALLERGEALDKVVAILELKIDNGAYVEIDQLAALIGQTKSASLYAKARQQLFKDDWALLCLYKSRYPDPDIEKTLYTRLYKIAANDAEPMRRYIVDAMRDVGSEIVLPTLEAILDQTHKAGSRKDFLTSVETAIAAIKERGSATGETVSKTTEQAQLHERSR
jgi:TIR domain